MRRGTGFLATSSELFYLSETQLSATWGAEKEANSVTKGPSGFK